MRKESPLAVVKPADSSSFEVRVCVSCGLRYPLMIGHPFGTRCPHCLGETKAALRRVINEEVRCETKKSLTGKSFAVLLDNIRSAWNVGSILRSADGFGFNRAYLCGITPTPALESVRKTALGAENFVKWSQHKDALKLTKRLKKNGWNILALEDEARAQPLSRALRQPNTLLILGSEVAGVDPELLDLAHQIVYIPMRGQKKSFNVANAFSIAAYALSQSVF